MPTYDKAYFIEKFSRIPAQSWNVGEYVAEDGSCCALGPCGVRDNPSTNSSHSSPEGDALCQLFSPNLVAHINDGLVWKYPQFSPKERILAALRDLPDRPIVSFEPKESNACT